GCPGPGRVRDEDQRRSRRCEWQLHVRGDHRLEPSSFQNECADSTGPGQLTALDSTREFSIARPINIRNGERNFALRFIELEDRSSRDRNLAHVVARHLQIGHPTVMDDDDRTAWADSGIVRSLERLTGTGSKIDRDRRYNGR